MNENTKSKVESFDDVLENIRSVKGEKTLKQLLVMSNLLNISLAVQHAEMTDEVRAEISGMLDKVMGVNLSIWTWDIESKEEKIEFARSLMADVKTIETQLQVVANAFQREDEEGDE